MKTVRKLFYGISFLILLICIVILALAMNPQWSEKLSVALYGEDAVVGQETGNSDEESTDVAKVEDLEVADAGETDTEETPATPQVTPMAVATAIPAGAVEETDGEDDARTELTLSTITIKTVCPTVQVSTYEEPATVSLTIPETVNSLSGYVPVTSQMTQVTEAEAKKLSEELTEGELGDNLVFDKDFYPYYHMLQGTERELYRQIYANAYSVIESFKPCEEIYSTQIDRVMEAVFKDNPVLFWVDTAYSCKYDPDGKCVEITLQFHSTVDKLEQSKTTFNEKVEEILSVARTLENDYEKEKYVHDKLLAKVSYSADADMGQSAYSALVNGQTVCAGYARAFQYLMQQLEIPCYYCGGYSGENHAWNIVKLYGEYYNVDVTWDDTTPGTYDYFNKTDVEFGTTHVRKNLSVKLPACTGTLYGGLEETSDSEHTAESTDTQTGTYRATVEKYYDTMIERIEAMGKGSAEYTDLLAAEAWEELEEDYSNGNLDFREDYLIRALQRVGADYCIITLSPQVVTENAYNITCTIVVK